MSRTSAFGRIDWGRIDWGHCLLLAGLTGWTAFYLHDAWSASARIRNLILILPASLLAFVLIAVVLAGLLREARQAVPEEAAASPPDSLRDRLRPLILMGLFTLYILSLPLLGFDLGSLAFLLLALIADGERRPLLLLLFPPLFAAVSTWLFRWLLPYPLPTLVL